MSTRVYKRERNKLIKSNFILYVIRIQIEEIKNEFPSDDKLFNQTSISFQVYRKSQEIEKTKRDERRVYIEKPVVKHFYSKAHTLKNNIHFVDVNKT